MIVALLLVSVCVCRTGRISAEGEVQPAFSASLRTQPMSVPRRSTLARRTGDEPVNLASHESNEQGEPTVAVESLSEEPSEEGFPKTKTAETSSAVRAQQAVSRFYRETDRWVRSDRVATVEDIRAFVRAFNAVPVSRRKGALHRALNLIPDANVALLAGVLFDKSQPKEIVREVFNDVVNRPEEAKEPILKEIAKDKTHPCYSDAQWIFEVTGERPEGTVADE